MNAYAIEFASSTESELKRLPASVVERLHMAIVKLAMEPRPMGSTKLKGSTNTHRLRVGNYRIVYDVDDKKKNVLITRVRHRKDVYK